MRIRSERRQSRFALWSRRAALLSIPILIVAIVGHRVDSLSVELTVALLALALTLSASAIVAAIAAFGGIWKDARLGFRAAMLGLALGSAIVAYPAILLARLISLPALAEITTSFDNLPAFTATDWAHPPPVEGQQAVQGVAYPDIAPRIYGVDPELVFAELVVLVEARGWMVRRQDPPRFDLADPLPAVPDVALVGQEPTPLAADSPPIAGEEAILAIEPLLVAPGIIEAVARTSVVGFREDIVIRVGFGTSGTVVDIRSASRHFEHDFGSNARRIRELIEDLDQLLPGTIAE